MPGCPEQFRMGVTHIELGQPTLAVLTDDRVSGESVLDLSSGRGCLHTSEPSRSEAHTSQGNPSTVRKGTDLDDFPTTDSRHSALVVLRAWSNGRRGVRASRTAPAATRGRSPKMTTAAITAPAMRPATTSPM